VQFFTMGERNEYVLDYRADDNNIVEQDFLVYNEMFDQELFELTENVVSDVIELPLEGDPGRVQQLVIVFPTRIVTREYQSMSHLFIEKTSGFSKE